MYSAKNDTYKIVIEQDEYPESPLEWDNLGTLVCFHGRYDLGSRGHGLRSNMFSGWGELRKYLMTKLKATVVLPLYLYDHSGITMRTTPFSCPWDSGQVGFIYTTAARCRELGVSLRHKEIERQLVSEVETYDQFLRGDVYGYTLYKRREVVVTDPADPEYTVTEERWEETDSCWGFYGTDWKTNGIADGLVDEARELLEAL